MYLIKYGFIFWSVLDFGGAFFWSVNRQTAARFFLLVQNVQSMEHMVLCPMTRRSATVNVKTLNNHQSSLLCSVLTDWINQVSFNIVWVFWVLQIDYVFLIRPHCCNNKVFPLKRKRASLTMRLVFQSCWKTALRRNILSQWKWIDSAVFMRSRNL